MTSRSIYVDTKLSIISILFHFISFYVAIADVWITTQGTRQGLSRLIGRALSQRDTDEESVLIGIANCHSSNNLSFRRHPADDQVCALSFVEHDDNDNYTVFQKKTSTHIIGYKLRNSCLISERELMFMFAICRRPSVCLSSVCLSVVCNVRAPYLGD